MRIAWEQLDEIGEGLREAVQSQLERIGTADEALTSVQLARVVGTGAGAAGCEVRVTATLGKRKLVVARRGETPDRAVMLGVAALEATLRRLLSAAPRVVERAAPSSPSAAPSARPLPVRSRALPQSASAPLLEIVSRGWESARVALRPEWLDRFRSGSRGKLVPSVEVLTDGAARDDMVETRTMVETTVVETRRTVVETRHRGWGEAPEAVSRARQRLFDGDPQPQSELRPAPARTRVRARLTRPARVRRRPRAGWVLPGVGAVGLLAAGVAVWVWQGSLPAYRAVATRGAALAPVSSRAVPSFSATAQPGGVAVGTSSGVGSGFGATSGGALAPVTRPGAGRQDTSAFSPTAVESIAAVSEPGRGEFPMFWAIAAAE